MLLNRFLLTIFCLLALLLQFASAQDPVNHSPVQIITGFESLYTTNDTQYKNKYHECRPGRNLYKLSFIDPDTKKLLADGEGMRTECTDIEKCARFCWESNTTCGGVPESKIAVNGYYYLVAWNITEESSYLLFCCAASVLTKFNNCTNITIDETTQKVKETTDKQKVIKDLYFENGKYHKPTLIEICEKFELTQVLPVKISCKLPRRGIHPDNNNNNAPPPPQSSLPQFIQQGGLFNGEVGNFFGSLHGGFPFVPPGFLSALGGVGAGLGGIGAGLGGVGAGLGGGLGAALGIGIGVGAGVPLGVVLGLVAASGRCGNGNGAGGNGNGNCFGNGNGNGNTNGNNGNANGVSRLRRAEDFDQQSRWMVFQAASGSKLLKAYDDL